MPYKAESVWDLLCLLLIQHILYRSVGSQMDLLKPLGQVLQGVEMSQYLINTVTSVKSDRLAQADTVYLDDSVASRHSLHSLPLIQQSLDT